METINRVDRFIGTCAPWDELKVDGRAIWRGRPSAHINALTKAFRDVSLARVNVARTMLYPVKDEFHSINLRIQQLRAYLSEETEDMTVYSVKLIRSFPAPMNTYSLVINLDQRVFIGPYHQGAALRDLYETLMREDKHAPVLTATTGQEQIVVQVVRIITKDPSTVTITTPKLPNVASKKGRHGARRRK